MADINFIPEAEKSTDSINNIKGKLTVVSIVILILAAIAAFVTLSFFAYYISQRDKLVSRVEDASEVVNNYKEVEELLVVTKDKAISATQIRKSRLDSVNVLTTLAEIIPKDIYFSSVKIGVEGITFTGKGRTSADVAGLVSALKSGEGTKILSEVSINSLVRDSNGGYSFGLTGKLNR
ncbi:hypothetical protein A2164_02965 [Candidatus Curtissbacteria bacterium RBG_13_35_7]|uniref:Uncharacterized protein n=1 Tax=Candidatus Curtissbacteria bacterium RBG_13_35_7 TaxID=1797705 RepID=A0A1F5G271_9BACT|nr:MAG: hypothetical protein A2164_02965 [Candidatus Curtissbacteria bacterium RBG_13_35_7]